MRSSTQRISAGNDASSLPNTPSASLHSLSMTEMKHADFASDPTFIEDEQGGDHYDDCDNSDLLTTEKKAALRDSDCYVRIIDRYKEETVWKAIAKFERDEPLHGCFTVEAEVNPTASTVELPAEAISAREQAVILLQLLHFEGGQFEKDRDGVWQLWQEEGDDINPHLVAQAKEIQHEVAEILDTTWTNYHSFKIDPDRYTLNVPQRA